MEAVDFNTVQPINSDSEKINSPQENAKISEGSNTENKTTEREGSISVSEKVNSSAEVSRLSEGLKTKNNTTTSKSSLSGSDLHNIVSSVNEYVRVFSTKVSFGYDYDNERQVILVKDNETGEVIRQIPPKEMINLLKQLEKISGIIYHNHV